MKEKIHIYHTNDVHSHFEHWPKISHFLRERKQIHEACGEEVFIFDCGDFIDRRHAFTEATAGEGNVELLNEAEYTAVTIGNNEGLTLRQEELNRLYSHACFDVVAANIFIGNGKRPPWALTQVIYETSRGTTIGVTGVTAYYGRLYGLLGWEINNPFEELQRQVEKLRDQADILIVLSHLGMEDDQVIAETMSGVHLILGGHTHHMFPQGKQVKDTMLAAAGRYGEYVGYVSLDWNPVKEQRDIKAQLFETALLSQPQDAAKAIHAFEQKGKMLLEEKIVDLPEALAYSWNKDTDLSSLLCQALLDWCEGDCSMLNAGLFLSSLEKGPITKYDLHRMLPHPINPCTIDLTGEELQKISLRAEDTSLSELEFQGLGFRGVKMGKFSFEGMTRDEKGQLTTVAGQPYHAQKIYRLATLDMFTFGVFFPEIQNAERKRYFLPEFIRELMAWKLKKVYK